MKSLVKISVSSRNNKTFLQECFFTPPFKVANITWDKNAAMLDLVLMSSSPGILDKDEYDIEVTINESASLHLHTQSFQRLFQMTDGASQQLSFRMEEGASLTYLPHPAVPHAGSIFTNRTNIFLKKNCTLTWGEIITCGRQLKNEMFSFSKYHNITEVYLNNKLVIRENLLMQPSLNDVQVLGQLEGYTHQASLIYLCDDVSIPEKMNAVLELLATKTSIEYGISKTPVCGFLVRILGYKAEQLHECLKVIGRMMESKPSLVDSTG